MLQRVNPLVPSKLQNLEPTDLPVGALSKQSFATFDIASKGARFRFGKIIAINALNASGNIFIP
jgi:hypothetical protein